MRNHDHYRQCGLPNAKGEPCRTLIGSGYVCKRHAKTPEGLRVLVERRKADLAKRTREEDRGEAQRAFLRAAKAHGLDDARTREAFEELRRFD